MARRYLGSVLAQEGDLPGARAIVQPLIDAPDSPHRAAALVLVGKLAALEHRPDEARVWLEQAAASGDEELMLEARSALAELGGPPPAPSRTSRLAEMAPQVAVLLGEIALAEGQAAEAEEWLQPALDAQSGSLRSRASAALALLLAERGDVPRSREALRAADPAEPAAAEARQLLAGRSRAEGAASGITLPPVGHGSCMTRTAAASRGRSTAYGGPVVKGQ